MPSHLSVWALPGSLGAEDGTERTPQGLIKSSPALAESMTASWQTCSKLQLIGIVCWGF